ncbi:MAG: sensor histidine kinase [Bacteroidia bacterium]
MQTRTQDILKNALLTAPLIGAFSALPLYFVQVVGVKKEFLPNQDFNLIRAMLMMSLAVLSLWAMNFVLFHKFETHYPQYTHHRVRYFVSSLLAVPSIFIIVRGLHFLLSYTFAPAEIEHPVLPFFPVLGILATNFVVLIMLELIVLRYKETQTRIENEELRRLSIEAKHLQLQHQLQPHFLFNALATLKSLIKKQPLVAENYVVQLSQLLRSTLSTHHQALVSVEAEMEIVQHYLMLQNTRFAQSIHTNISLSSDIKSQTKLPYLSLLTLVENATKHNVFSQEQPLEIFIFSEKEDYLVVKNTFRPKPQPEKGTNIGLSNLQQRYRLLASEYEVIIQQEAGCFWVKIPLIKA